ncbi:MAG: ABC transporter substrate-binding protein [Actinomycetota bacterium]|nr:ABC transporter substrate-binding protein [Actinomycetota bacterium]
MSRKSLASPMVVAVLASAVALIASSCAPASTGPGPTSSGGVVTFAETPGITPNYILPLASATYFTIVNIPQFSQDLYLPLYWFGTKAGEPVLNPTLSIAKPPSFSDHNTRVTISLKHWTWSNGQPITARDVTFWLNLLSAVTDPAAPTVGSSSAPGPGWGAFVPGGFPENVVSYRQTSTYSLTLRLNASYNPTWFTYNELSQIDPMPQASWDRLSASSTVGNYDVAAEQRSVLKNTSPPEYVPSNPGTGSSGALGVAEFLNLQAQSLGTYLTNPLWRVVDGPFRLAGYTPSGYVKMVPNPRYSGTPKPRIQAFEELPFTSASSEFSALRSGALTIGYIPSQDLAQRRVLERTGDYKFAPWQQFGIVDMKYNFTNTTTGPIVRQLYFRQAFQSLVNQRQYINAFAGGIGSPGNGPVPTYPAHSPDESPLEAAGQVYPYSPVHARNLLATNGWRVQRGGLTVCVRPGVAPGDCGSGVRQNQAAAFTLIYASGSVRLTDEMEALQSTLKSEAGIDVTLKEESFSLVFSTALNNCSAATPCNGWELADWGANVSWVYSPDYFPTGGELFACGSSSNGGDYCNATNDANIAATHTAPSASGETKALFAYEDFLARQLPVVWMPNSPYQLTVYKAGLKNFVPQGVFDELYPQYYFVSK